MIGGKTVYLPQLVGIECPKCGAEVRLDRRDFTLRENLTSAVMPENIEGDN
jgi:hypothetical protein